MCDLIWPNDHSSNTVSDGRHGEALRSLDPLRGHTHHAGSVSSHTLPQSLICQQICRTPLNRQFSDQQVSFVLSVFFYFVFLLKKLHILFKLLTSAIETLEHPSHHHTRCVSTNQHKHHSLLQRHKQGFLCLSPNSSLHHSVLEKKENGSVSLWLCLISNILNSSVSTDLREAENILLPELCLV